MIPHAPGHATRFNALDGAARVTMYAAIPKKAVAAVAWPLGKP